jgi:Tol biopolymer transport system component
MNYRGIPTLILSVSLLGFCYPTFTQTAEELLPKAIQLEEVKGELEKALDIYQTIVREYPDNRPVAAQAYYHIGMCYEKLGREEAMKAYQQVIQNYGEQEEVVAKAQGRLSLLKPNKLTDKPDGIRIREIWKTPYQDYLGSVSFDGSLRAYIDWGEGDVAIHNLVTGEKKVLTSDAVLGDSTHFAETPVISKDGKQIAYSWWNPYNTNDLRIIDVDNPSPRLLYKNEGEEVYPAAWLSDHVLISSRYNMDSGTVKITSYNTLDGSFYDLKTFDKLSLHNIACSPDAKYIAYDFANDKNEGNSDINVIQVDKGKEIPIIEHPANDRVIGWLPGRSEFLFISDRSGYWDLWAISLDNKQPSGSARRIYNDIGQVRPVGFTQNGDCYFGNSRHKFNTYIAPFDAQTGIFNEASSMSLKGSNFWVNWSPDGQFLVYVRIDPNADNPLQLIVQHLKTGEERKLAGNLTRSMTPCWSPDGNKIMVVGREIDKEQTSGHDKRAVYLVDVRTGQTDQILLLSDYEFNMPEDDAAPLSDLLWSVDGRSIYLLFFKDRLIRHDLGTGEDKILFMHTDFNRGTLGLSPNGENLLFGVKVPGEEKSTLITIPAEGGEENELCTTQEADNFSRALWSPDGKNIFFTERSDGTNLWRLPSEGGKPQKIWHSDNIRVPIYSIHPDGGQIAYAIHEGFTELKVIENLISELEKIDNQSK